MSHQWQQTLEAIYDSAVDAILTIDHTGVIGTANPATEQMFGYLPGELIGRNIKVLMPPPYQEQHDGYLRNYLTTGIKKIIGIGREVVGLRKDGTVFPIHLAVSEVLIDDQRVFAGYIRDLSDFKQLQAKLMTNERLAAIGQMVSGLAHESRNAFQRSHACLAELALDVASMPDSLTLVSKVQKALDDVHMLLEEVRCYAAPIILERQSCNLEMLVRETWQHVLDTENATCTPGLNIIKAADFPDECLIDILRIGLVLRNLLENALMAAPAAAAITVKLSLVDATDSQLEKRNLRGIEALRNLSIEVIDQGPGIPEADLETIFAPFYTTKTKGTGLGLAVARRYVTAHEGRIYVKPCHSRLWGPSSTENRGACLIVELPFVSKSPSRNNSPREFG